MRVWWWLCLVGVMHGAAAGEIIATDVSHEHNVYHVHFVAIIDAKSRAVRKALTDYPRLTRLSATLLRSEVLLQESSHQRVRLVFHACVLVFCRDLTKTQDIYSQPNGDIVAAMVPELSDFLQGNERWHVAPLGRRTRVEYTAESVPKFFVPPLIGPAIMKSKIRRELLDSATRLEHVAQNRP